MAVNRINRIQSYLPTSHEWQPSAGFEAGEFQSLEEGVAAAPVAVMVVMPMVAMNWQQQVFRMAYAKAQAEQQQRQALYRRFFSSWN